MEQAYSKFKKIEEDKIPEFVPPPQFFYTDSCCYDDEQGSGKGIKYQLSSSNTS